MLREDVIYIPYDEEETAFDELRGNVMQYMYSDNSAEDAIIVEEIFRIIRDLENAFERMNGLEERNKELENLVEGIKAGIIDVTKV